jgi:hypothetical protein
VHMQAGDSCRRAPLSTLHKRAGHDGGSVTPGAHARFKHIGAAARACQRT